MALARRECIQPLGAGRMKDCLANRRARVAMDRRKQARFDGPVDVIVGERADHRMHGAAPGVGKHATASGARGAHLSGR